jgi:cytidylate kinase
MVKIDREAIRGMVVAIDGPAGSGKTTTARMLAARLGFTYLDTGAMYRALTYFALRQGISPSDGLKLQEVAEHLKIEFEPGESQDRVVVNGEDVTTAIRTPEVTRHVSEASAHAGVRLVMVAKQKEFGRGGSIVAEGRDATTVVFPEADVKVFLTASVGARAERRRKDMKQLGVTTTVDEQREDIQRRDDYDSTRAHSPLCKAVNAAVIDTSRLTPDEQVQKIVDLVMAGADKR